MQSTPWCASRRAVVRPFRLPPITRTEVRDANSFISPIHRGNDSPHTDPGYAGTNVGRLERIGQLLTRRCGACCRNSRILTGLLSRGDSWVTPVESSVLGVSSGTEREAVQQLLDMLTTLAE